MEIKSINLAWIASSDLTKAKEFFSNNLGLEISSDSPDNGWLELKAKNDSFLLGIGEVKEDNEESPIAPGCNAVVTFTVANIEEAKSELTAKNVDVYDIVEVPGHVKMAFMQDFDGNLFQLVEMLDNK
jgi:predicted enzyme related to lactoylglutathione lyase